MRSLFLLLFSMSALFGLGQKAVVSGKIKGNGELLPSAIVAVDSTRYNTVTDLDGSFKLVDIPYGKHLLSVRYVGFQTLTQTIDVSAASLDLGTIELKENSQNLSEVEIKGELKRGSENKAISLTKESKKIVTVLSSETMKKLPDRNAAESVKRVAGAAVQNNKGEGSFISLRGTPMDWTATLVNGDRLPVADEENTTRSFEFEVLPSDLVDYIVVSRSATPDLEADNVGGTINFLTKSSVEKRTLQINVGTGYNVLPEKPSFNANILWGDRSKNGKFSYVLNASYFGRYYAADATRFMYGNNFNHAINRYELRQYTGMRNTIAVNAAAEYQITNKFKLGAKFLQGAMLDDKWQNKLAYTYRSGESSTLKQQFIHGKLNRDLYGGELNAEIKASEKVKLNLRYATYYNRFQYGNFPYKKNDPRNGYFTAEFTATGAGFVNYADIVPITLNGGKVNDVANPNNDPNYYDNVKLLDIDNPYGGGDHYSNVRPDITNRTVVPDSMEFLRAFTETNKTWEYDPYVFQWDLSHQVSNKVKLQFGTKHRMKDGSRELSYHEWTLRKRDGQNDEAVLSYFETQPNNYGKFLTEYGAPYSIGLPVLTRNQLTSLLDDLTAFNDTSLIEYYMNERHVSYRNWVGSSYKYREFQNSAYFMVNASLGKFDITGGLRVEHTLISEKAYDLKDSLIIDYTTGDVYYPRIDVYSKFNYWSFLPSVNFTYKVREDMNLRLALSRTFHRQNFQEIKPGAALIKYADYLYIIGNPNLKPAYSYNVDLMYELFWGNKGLFSLGGYFKYIKDHIFSVATADIDPISGFVIRTYRNAKSSYVLGVELNVSRKFDFLPGFASGFGLSGNVTYSYSRMQVPGRPLSQAMAEQTPLLYNVALFYEKYGLSARIAFNYTGAYLQELNLATHPNTGELLHKDNDFDMFVAEIYALDFQVSYDFKKHYSVYVTGSNLLDWPFKEYIGNPNRPYRVEYYKEKIAVGFKFDL